jgi:hypothetical protein
MNLKMKKITREIADQLIQQSKPANSSIKQTANETCVTFNLTNGTMLEVKYNRKSLGKTYFITEK